MCVFKLKQLLRNKGILLPFLIVFSLFNSEIALAIWDKKCCHVRKEAKDNRISIDFKFFEYSTDPAKRNSFLEKFEAFYSTDDGRSSQFLLATMSSDQTERSYAWIGLKIKLIGEKVDIIYYPHDLHRQKTLSWKDDTHPILKVKNHSIFENENWISVKWYPEEDIKTITHMEIMGKWNENGKCTNKFIRLIYELNKKIAKLESNRFNNSNSFLDHEIKTVDKINTDNVFKEANTIIINGALSENIQIYTTLGKLVKSIVADNGIVKIELSVKQVYIVNIGQKSYKMAL